jgi:integrase
LPYKGLESLDIKEECIEKWAHDLTPRTARNYAYYFLNYLEWCKKKELWATAAMMLKDYEALSATEKYKHQDALVEYVKTKKTGTSDRRHTWFAVRSFYAYHRLPLPKATPSELNRMFRPSEDDKKNAIETSPLMLDDVRRLILNVPHPYKAALMTLLQSGMGLAEFEEFNLAAWRKTTEKLAAPEPLRIDLYREKTSRTTVKKYYTWLGRDAKELLSEWLVMRPEKSDSEALFLVYNKNLKRYVPLSGRVLSDKVRQVAKKIGLIKTDQLKRYRVHAHEFRDLFKSLCTLSGVSPVASEFFLGHGIDRLGYDKSPQYDEGWFRREYLKVEPRLNVLSNPTGGNLEERMDQMRREMVQAAVGKFAEAFGIDPVRVRIERQKVLGRALKPEEEIQALQLAIKKMREEATPSKGDSDPKRIVGEDELEKYLEEGWDVQMTLPSGKILVRKLE